MAQEMLRLYPASRRDYLRSFWSTLIFERIRGKAFDSEPRRSRPDVSISKVPVAAGVLRTLDLALFEAEVPFRVLEERLVPPPSSTTG